jgi:transmembrane sensor
MSVRNLNNEIKNTSNLPEGNELEMLIFKTVSNLKVPETIDKAGAWGKLEKSIENKNEKRGFKVSFNIYAIAASICFLIAGAYIFNKLYNKTVVCPRGQQLVLILPDSSVVRMNSSTKVSYKLYHWKKDRKLTLDGEAFFEVKKGQKFEVVTRQATISVLGTSFNVFARDNCLNVVCKTGVVAVSNKEKVILKAGDGCKSQNETQKFNVYKPVVAMQTGWLNGKFWFENALLTDVLKEIERQFNVNIIYSDTAKRYYTGYFTNDDLTEALKLVCLPMQLDYKINNDKIIINTMFNKNLKL